MLTIKLLFAFLLGVVAVLWTDAQRPLPQPALVPIEVTRIVVVTAVPSASPIASQFCAAGIVVFGDSLGELIQCSDNLRVWRGKP